MKYILHGKLLKGVRQLFMLVFLSLVSTLSLRAQFMVSGTVKDATGETVIGANVVEKSTTTGVITDFDGKFNLSVSDENSTLVISFVGYVSQEVPLNGRSTLEVTLEEDVQTLEELVVVGYGVQKKSVVTGAIASVKPEDIQKAPILRVEQALQGRTAGVQVTSTSGQPGEGLTVRVRGIGTTGNSDPLYIVDGMPTGGIDYLNPADIERMEVLKDAASAAIYGTRAANGVVLITTKSGKAGKAEVTYDMYYGIQNPWKKVSVLNASEYVMLMNEADANDGKPLSLGDPSSYQNTDWQDELFNYDAPIMNHQIGISGGNEKSTYSASGAYFTQEGIVGADKSEFDRFTFRLNSKHKISDKFTFGENLSFSHINRSGLTINDEYDSPLATALNMDPTVPVYNSDGTFAQPRSIFQEVVNPVASLDIVNQEYKLNKVLGNAFGEYEIIKGLKLRTNFGIDLAFGDERIYNPIYRFNGTRFNDRSSASREAQQWSTWLWENTLTYDKKIGDHNFTALLGTSAQEDQYWDLYGLRYDLAFDDFENAYINTGQIDGQATEGEAYHHALQSYFGRVNYSFADKYLFAATVRVDGSSNFGPNNRYAIFPSFSGGWVLSEESFYQNSGLSEKINFIKLRASWGQNGNENIDRYAFSSTISGNRNYTFGGVQTLVAGASPTRVSNPDLKWETSEQIDIGLEVGLLDDKLLFTGDYFIKKTKDFLVIAPILGHVGNDAPWANAGDMENKGIELALDWRSSVGDFNYSIGVNGSYIKNKVTYIGNAEKQLLGGALAGGRQVSYAMEGLPIGVFYGYQTDGIFQNQAEIETHANGAQLGDSENPGAQPGDFRYVDQNGDNVIDDKDRVMIGSPLPDFTFGLNLAADFKGFDFSAFIQGSIGNDIYNGWRRNDLLMTNMPSYMLDRWTKDAPSNEVPRVTFDDPNGNYSKVSDFFVEDGSYARLKTLQLGYTLPDQLISRAKLKRVRVYVSADNLFTITKYTGYDPEVGTNPDNALDIGIDRGIYPQARTYRVGANITF
ncbi:SusC/RagA family TonB-linked outer membrane protein [Xanthovirga aplysinae]|uniref:SusC/RagA family TonB-linked outer membrane protein n=1 Tax=Xanthovirga aplysinae TaxID=2529853 RepID=UPI0012BBBA24|nr:TonB-dependent receptor [Xanthovirga aplysinae]MTI33181.1 TonB-dependent receptor [Xanthovirga aplysinae]